MVVAVVDADVGGGVSGTGARERWVGGVRSVIAAKEVNTGSRGSHSGVGKEERG